MDRDIFTYYTYPYTYPLTWTDQMKSYNCNIEVSPKDYPYQVGTKDFKTLEEAEEFAKRRASEEHIDVVIKQRISVVKFPLPDLKVESLV